MSIDVLVVGGGPVGMTLAAELARYGAKVRIIEQAANEDHAPNALFLWSRTLELLDRTADLTPVIAVGQKLTAATVIAEGKPIGRIDFAAVDSMHPYILALQRKDAEHMLEAHLKGLGLQVERGSALISLSHTGGELSRPTGVKAVLVHADGAQEIVETKWLVGCDGVNSTVRKFLEMPLRGGGRESNWVLADIHVSGMELTGSEFKVYWHDKGAVAIYPIGGDLYRVVADISKASGTAEPTVGDMQALVDERCGGGLKLSDPVWLSSFRLSDRKVPDYRMGRVFLAGDAAHVHSPIGLQGLNMGIQDAVNLAWKLALVCNGTCPEERLLPSYSVERSAVSDYITTNIARLTAAARVRGQPVQVVRNLLGGALLGLSVVRRAFADRFSEISLGYAHSPLNGPEERAFPGPGPGDRMPPVQGEPPIGAGNAPRFALFADSSPEIDDVMRANTDLLEPALRKPLAPRCVWLVRPDGYVAAVSLDLDVKVIADYLDRLKEA